MDLRFADNLDKFLDRFLSLFVVINVVNCVCFQCIVTIHYKILSYGKIWINWKWELGDSNR